MKRDGVEAPERFAALLDNVPLANEAGASKSSVDLPSDNVRTIRPIRGARRKDKFCAARVRGNSLCDDGVFDGDCAIVRLTFERNEVTPGRLVAILTPYGLLLKHCYLALSGDVRLVSANPMFEDIILEPEEVTIQGLVVRIERDL